MSFYWEKPRYERSNPIENTIPGPVALNKYAQTGIDHTTQWKRIKPKTVIELCLEGKLEARAVKTIFQLGVITKEKLRAAMLKGLKSHRSPSIALKVIHQYVGVVF